ncbi:hypothetical protein Vretimale_2486, partial [Volvox reticuliferus]
QASPPPPFSPRPPPEVALQAESEDPQRVPVVAIEEALTSAATAVTRAGEVPALSTMQRSMKGLKGKFRRGPQGVPRGAEEHRKMAAGAGGAWLLAGVADAGTAGTASQGVSAPPLPPADG